MQIAQIHKGHTDATVNLDILEMEGEHVMVRDQKEINLSLDIRISQKHGINQRF